MTLLKSELKKLIDLFNLIIIGIIIFLLFIFIYNTYNNGVKLESINGESHYYKGKEYIEINKKYAYQYSDKIVSDEFLRDFAMQKADSIMIDKNGNQNFENYFLVISSLSEYYSKFSMTGNITVYGEKSTDVYSSFNGELPVFKYTDNWKAIYTIIKNAQSIFVIFAFILSSLIFSKEYASKMTPIILATKNGRATFAISKIKAFYIFISLTYLIINAIVLITAGFLWGFENPFADIRVITNGFYIPMQNPISCITLILFQLLTGYFAIIIISSIGILISSIIKFSYISMIITAAIFFFPLIFKFEYIQNETLKKIFMLMPFNIPMIFSNFWSVFDYSSMIVFITFIITVFILSFTTILSIKIYSNHKIS